MHVRTAPLDIPRMSIMKTATVQSNRCNDPCHVWVNCIQLQSFSLQDILRFSNNSNKEEEWREEKEVKTEQKKKKKKKTTDY